MLAAGAEIPEVRSIAARVPDASVDVPTGAPGEYMEEGGQWLEWRYRHEAHEADTAIGLPRIAAPTYIVFGTSDELVSEENQQALIVNAQPQHQVDRLDAYSHSTWTSDQAKPVLDRSLDFTTRHFGAA